MGSVHAGQFLSQRLAHALRRLREATEDAFHDCAQDSWRPSV